jgi:hypothetical protein
VRRAKGGQVGCTEKDVPLGGPGGLHQGVGCTDEEASCAGFFVPLEGHDELHRGVGCTDKEVPLEGPDGLHRGVSCTDREGGWPCAEKRRWSGMAWMAEGEKKGERRA